MQFGVCGHWDMAAEASKASYDYAEWSVGNVLKPRESQDEFLATLKELRNAALPYPVLNGFVPGDLKITGSDVDSSALQTFVATAMERSEVSGV